MKTNKKTVTLTELRNIVKQLVKENYNSDEEKYLSDEDIEKSYQDYTISDFDIKSSGYSGGMMINFKNREPKFENWIKYDSGKIAFDNWYY